MNKNKYISHLAMAGLMVLGLTACNDWLTIYPQNKVVEEDFWEDKNDLLGVRYAAYTQMSSTISKFIIWGDLRSDSYLQNSALTSNTSTRDRYKKIILAQLDSTMSEFDWGSVYSTINYCNKVLSRGEEVLANDAQFTRTEWQEIKAEMTALRALNYFYLLRAFKDIPYTTTTISSDKEVMKFPLTNQLDVLDSLITDVEAVKGKARNRFADKADTKGLMTNTAIYALLADMYLWRSALREGRNADSILVSNDTTVAPVKWWEADAQKVVEYSQASIDALANQENFSATSYGTTTSKTSDFNLASNYQIYNCNLITNEDATTGYNNKVSTITVDSYDAIFSSSRQNSSESIFEFQFSASDNRKNEFVGGFWGANNTSSQLVISNDAISAIYASTNDMNLDTRTWYSCTMNLTRLASTNTKLTDPVCLKYERSTFLNDGTKVTASEENDGYRNWIFYRLTDVMLMQAEAYAVLGGTSNNNKCKAIVDAIHKRSTVGEKEAKTTGSTRDDRILWVMNERQIELLGEGKRWFDLVRWAERRGGGVNPDPREPQYTDGSNGVQDMVTTFMNHTYPSMENTLKNRIKNRYGLYSPIYYMEIKAGDYIISQNPVWNREK